MSIVKNKVNKRDVYKAFLETEDGKYILNDIYRYCRINKPSYVEGSNQKTAFNEGAKSVAYEIKILLKHSSKDIESFIKEYTKNKRSS